MQSALFVACLVQAASPAWVGAGGRDARYPDAKYLTGFAVVAGEDALERAKGEAVAELARRIEVRIQSDTLDYSAEKNGAQTYAVAAYTRASTDVRLTGLTYESFVEGAKTYVLAVLDRSAAVRSRRGDRDAARERLKECLASAERQIEGKQPAAALSTFLGCRGHATDALTHTSIMRVLAGDDAGELEVYKEIAAASQRIDERVATLLQTPVQSLSDAVSFVALQLSQQGLGRLTRFTIAPLTYANTEFSSAFGEHFAEELERALASREPAGKSVDGDVAVRGVYTNLDGAVEVRLTARQPKSGQFVAGAQAKLPAAGIPSSLPLLPRNYQQALEDQRILGKGELVSGNLRFELLTNKGYKDLVFKEHEELQVLMRVNQPAYIRLIYVLESGEKVMLEQAYYIDGTKVNLAVQYPDTFEIAPPFGVDQIYAVAFTERPEPLATVKQVIGGQEYEVVADATTGLVRHRGISKKKKDQSVDAKLSITTLGASEK
jgi:hypothetical protein